LIDRQDADTLVLMLLTALTLDWGQRRMVGLLSDISDIHDREQHMVAPGPSRSSYRRVQLGLFHERSERVIAEADRHADLAVVLYLDLDGFKSINYTYGHDVGNRCLLLWCTGCRRQPADHLGGDEFAVLLARSTDAVDVREVADKLRDEIERHVTVAEGTLRVTVSIGAAVYPDDGTTADASLQVADEATCHQKARRP